MTANPNVQRHGGAALGEVAGFVVTPLAAVAAMAAWTFSDMPLTVGPTGRLAIALGVMAVVALLGRPLSAGASIAVAAGASLAVGGVTILLLAFAFDRVGCSPAGPLDVAFHLAPVGAATTLALFATLAAAIIGGRRGPAVGAIAATATGVVGAILAFATLAASFPGISCAYVPA